MTTSKLLLFLIPLILVASSAHATSPRVETHEYIAAGGDFFIRCDAETGLNVGGACSNLDGSETSVTITLADEAFTPVGGYYRFADDTGRTIYADGLFCGSTTVDVPSAASKVRVFVDQAFSTFDCPTPGVGTIGTVTLAYE